MLSSIRAMKIICKATLKVFLLKNTFKVTLQYLFNVFILFNTVSYIEINLKVNPKMCTFKNLEETSQKQLYTLQS